jgi:hypothetical protein
MGRGVGRDGNSEKEPHEKRAGLARDHAHGPCQRPLRRPDASRDTLPIASDGQRPVPNAWRPEHGSNVAGGAGAAGAGSDGAWRVRRGNAVLPRAGARAVGGCAAAANR